jgi:RHS repeat-associated protein
LLEITDREWSGLDVTSFYRFGDRLVAQRDAESGELGEGPGAPLPVLRFVAGDHLGSTSLVTEETSGAVVRAVRYEPYGRVRDEFVWGDGAGGGPGAEDATPGAIEALFNGKQRIRGAFGMEGDPLARGLLAYDFGARFYMPEYAGWASADEVTPDLVWEANPFAYVRGNPLKYRDPDGHAACGEGDDYAQWPGCAEIIQSQRARWNTEHVDEPFKNGAQTLWGLAKGAVKELAIGKALGAVFGGIRTVSRLEAWRGVREAVRAGRLTRAEFARVGTAAEGAMAELRAAGKSAWNLSPLERGTLIEDYLVATTYRGAYHVGLESRGFFPLIDVELGRTVGSIKTIAKYSDGAWIGLWHMLTNWREP